jgi:hypothetical protein
MLNIKYILEFVNIMDKKKEEGERIVSLTSTERVSSRT